MYIMLFGLFVSSFVLLKIFKNNKKEKMLKTFKATKTKQNFDILNIICKLVEKKLKQGINLSTFIDKQLFYNLKLIYAPVYVLDVKRIGVTHTKLFLKAVSKLNKQFNLVLINLDNLNIVCTAKCNVVTLTSNQLNYKTLCLLNNLNVNKSFNFNNVNKNYDFAIKNFNVNLDDFNADVILDIKGRYKLSLPINPLGYIATKNKTLCICDCFGEVFTEIEPKVNIKIIDNNLYIKINKPTTLKFKLYLKESVKNDLKLFTFDILIKGFSEKIKWLKQKAVEELNSNPFILKDFSKIKINNLTNFFKLATLRKQYLNDYLYLLKNIFGLTLNKDILNVYPNHFIQQDFSIKYVMNGEEFEVNYTFEVNDKVKLLYVGHKLGYCSKANFSLPLVETI